MYADVVLGLDHGAFEEALEIAKEDKGVHLDTELDAEDWQALVRALQGAGRGAVGRAFPAGRPRPALGRDRRGVRLVAVGARQGLSPAERHSRRLGHRGQRPGDGVRQYGRDLGHRRRLHPRSLDRRARLLWRISDQRPGRGRRRRHPHPAISDPGRARDGRGQGAVDGRGDARGLMRELARVFDLLERHYRDMQDIEFTVERGKLWMLQTRSGKRTAKAALRIAVDMAQRRADHARRRRCCASIRRRSTSCSTRRSIPTPSATSSPRACPPRPGAASRQGGVRRRHRRAMRGSAGEKVILVRIETSPEDIHGMHAAEGILTARGGMTSHAAVVARGMGRPCVSGAGTSRIDYKAQNDARRRPSRCARATIITIDGSTGEVMLGAVPTVQPELVGDFGTLMDWADKVRRLQGPRQCRDAARLPHRARVRRRGHRPVPHRAYVLRRRADHRVRQMILAEDESGPPRGARQAAAGAAQRFRRDLPDHGGPAGDDPPARSAAARIPAARGGGVRRGRGGRRRRRSRR